MGSTVIESVCQIRDYRQILKLEMQQRQNRNANYSLRAFARDLKLSPSMLSDVLKSKHGLSRSTARKVAGALGFNANEFEYFCDLVESQDGRSDELRAAANARLQRYQSMSVFTELELDIFQMMASWHHAAILDLISFESFQADPRWIARHLKISPIDASTALDRLFRLGILQQTSRGIECKIGPYETAKDVPSIAGRRFHEQVLKKAITALNEQHSDDREVSTAILAIDASEMGYIKARLREFQKELVLHLAKAKNKNRLCAFSLQFFKICDEESLH